MLITLMWAGDVSLGQGLLRLSRNVPYAWGITDTEQTSPSTGHQPQDGGPHHLQGQRGLPQERHAAGRFLRPLLGFDPCK